jgi:AcrR family transcriptional regulator
VTPPSGKAKSLRVKQKRRQARRDILAAARRVLREQGIDAVTLASVAAELGMTKQAIYHYFPSKDVLVRHLVASLLDDEIEILVDVVDALDPPEQVLGALIRAFYQHYIGRLDTFRLIYCQTQLGATGNTRLDEATLREQVNPSTRRLFDVLESRLASDNLGDSARQRLRRLAFTAWTSVLGLLTMLSIAEANGDRLRHSDSDLLDVLSGVFEQAERSCKG